MGYLKFTREDFRKNTTPFNKEFVLTNKTGCYSSSTLEECHTRKYHGLFVVPIENLENENHVLLSSLDTSLIEEGRDIKLNTHEYQQNTLNPKGYEHMESVERNGTLLITYTIGKTILTKEIVFVDSEDRLYIKYKLIESSAEQTLRLQPLLAFRHIHKLSKHNSDINSKIKKIENGVSLSLYDNYPDLNMQINKSIEFVENPDWYYNFEYREERKRGYDSLEDLYTPGYFELKISKGEEVIFSVGTSGAAIDTIKRSYAAQKRNKLKEESFHSCLKNAAEQFIIKSNNGSNIKAGHPWFGVWGRDTMLSLPGLTIATDNIKEFPKVLDTMVKKVKNGLLPNMGTDNNHSFNSIDAPLLLFHALQRYSEVVGKQKVWKKYKKVMLSILDNYSNSKSYNIELHNNGLIYGGTPGVALTWMDAIVDETPVTQRKGYCVEINCLWYNAISFVIDLADFNNDTYGTIKWINIPEKIKQSFNQLFCSTKHDHLADYVDGDNQNFDIRPNQLFATALPYSPISHIKKVQVLKVVKQHLITHKGVRTLTPTHQSYCGTYSGDQKSRDSAYHQGTVWPWLLEFYAESLINTASSNIISELEDIFHNFEADMFRGCVGSIPEIYDGDHPHSPRGATSQAWSVSALLWIKHRIDTLPKEGKLENKTNKHTKSEEVLNNN